MKQNGMKFLAALAAAGLLAGCAGGGNGGGATSGPAAETGEIVKGGNAVISLGNEIQTPLDPIQATLQSSRQVMDPMCERLYEELPDGSVSPMLAAELPEVSDDGLTLTIPLREGVVFNDETPFNAEAVKHNLERAVQDPLSIRALAKQYIASVEVVDEHTVEIRLTRQYSPILSELTDFTGMIASPTQLEAEGENFTNSPVCVGPFEWSSRVPGGDITLTRSDVYYDADLVNLDELTFRPIQDFQVKETNIESGDVQFGAVTEPFYSRMKDSDDVHVQMGIRPGATGFTFNVGNVAGVGKPVGEADNIMAQHPELREAFALAIDRDALTQAMLGADAPSGCSPIPAESVYASEIECTPHDVEKAKQLIEESGVPTPIKLKFTVPTYDWVATGAQVIQAMVKEVGFDVEIVTAEALSVFDDLRSGSFELSNMPLGANVADPAFHMSFETGVVNNYSGYSNPEVDALIAAARETFDVQERTDLYHEAIEEYNKAFAYVYTGGIVTHWATSSGFLASEGVTPSGNIYLKTAGFSELP